MEPLLRKSRKLIGREPDLIVDLYDFSLAHVSRRQLGITGHSHNEAVKHYAKEFLDAFGSETVSSSVKDLLVHGMITLVLRIKKKGGGSVKEELDIRLLFHNNVPYAVITTMVLE
ncbi:MAG: hypothetical protein JW834_00275 [Candidatus Diapherotrites archaeon]|nr:hypothetical protein [Candidatus Diapherotrites archaeon]